MGELILYPSIRGGGPNFKSHLLFVDPAHFVGLLYNLSLCIYMHFLLCRWHDAGTYDAKSKTGGPNGSIRNEEEYSHGSNSGLKKAIDWCGKLFFL